MLHHCGTIQINTQRLHLTPFRITDAKDMYEHWASDPEVTLYLSFRAHSNLKVTIDYLSSICYHYTRQTYNWAIRRKQDNALIGNICLTKINDTEQSAEIAYMLSRSCWNQGIISEAMETVLALLFSEVKFRSVYGRHDVRNVASGRVMEKLGMSRTVILPLMATDHSGLKIDLQEWRITAEEWDKKTVG